MRETQGPATPALGGERHVKYSTTNPFYLSTGIVAGKSLGNSERLCRSLWLIQPPRKGWPASIIGIITRQAAQVELRKVDPLRDRRRSRHFEQCFQCRATFASWCHIQHAIHRHSPEHVFLLSRYPNRFAAAFQWTIDHVSPPPSLPRACAELWRPACRSDHRGSLSPHRLARTAPVRTLRPLSAVGPFHGSDSPGVRELG